MLEISQANIVIPVSPFESRDQRPQSGPSEELLSISMRLKDGIEALSAWVQLHPILHRLDPESLTSAAKELIYLSSVFQNAHLELIGYNQQIPEPSDSPIAGDMQKLLEKCFVTDIAQETGADIAGHGYTSWGELILSGKQVTWSSYTMKQLFDHVSSASWRKTRQILIETADLLP